MLKSASGCIEAAQDNFIAVAGIKMPPVESPSYIICFRPPHLSLKGQRHVRVRHRRSPGSPGEEPVHSISQPGDARRRPGFPARPVHHHRSQYPSPV